MLTTLELAPTSALAQEPVAAQPAEDPKLTEAQALYNEGETRFQLSEYDAALKLWKRAFAILGNGEDTRAIRNALIYNIAEAHSRAYDVSRNPTHLRTAKDMLDRYRKSHRELYGDDPGAVQERAEADERIAELDKKIAASEAKGEVAVALADGSTTDGAIPTNVQPQPQPQPSKPLSPSQQWEHEVKYDPVLGPQWEKGGKQVGGGAVLVSMGGLFTLIGAGLVAWGVTLRTDDDPFFNGSGSFVSGGVFGVIGLGMLIPGAILIAQGTQKRKAVREAKPRPTGMVLPVFDPQRGRGGVAFTLRF